MNKILDQLPYSNERGLVLVQGQSIPVMAHPIIVWVAISVKDTIRLPESVSCIPAILDTGNTFGFSIAESQLIEWTGLRADSLEVLGPMLINRQELNRHAADVWLCRNQRGKRDVFQDEPFRLELRDGIAIYPSDRPIASPRLPLLGLRAIDENGLRCTINGKNRRVSLSAS
ncbi:MAG: hypothetical protein HUU20_16800 [Pirellulales bacterium]|nr:hypothetical protein [Pirellulales bacterium]